MYDNIVQIESIEFLIKNKRKGFGRATINYLKNKYPNCQIKGQSMPYEGCKIFWQKQGAQFDSCSSCDSFKECGGSEYNDLNCDSPLDYSFTIPTNSPLQNKEIKVCKNIDSSIPVLVIGFEESEENLDERDSMIRICNNINSNFDENSIYISTLENDRVVFELNKGIHLPDWFNNKSSDFIKQLSSIYKKNSIQIVGMHRELCVTQTAAIIKSNIPNLEPIIINNDDYTISASVSVEYGDTIDRILLENGYLARHIL